MFLEAGLLVASLGSSSVCVCVCVCVCVWLPEVVLSLYMNPANWAGLDKGKSRLGQKLE